MAKTEDATEQSSKQNIDKLVKKLDLLDQRLDNIDSTVSAVVERVMRQAVTLTVTCPNCGKKIEIGILGTPKPSA